jgi:hypothetical protein
VMEKIKVEQPAAPATGGAVAPPQPAAPADDSKAKDIPK